MKSGFRWCQCGRGTSAECDNMAQPGSQFCASHQPIMLVAAQAAHPIGNEGATARRTSVTPAPNQHGQRNEKIHMKRPTVRQTHAICDSLNARAVIVLAFSEDGIAGASYGETKLECGQIGYTMDRIIEAIEDGRIPIWATRESEAARNERIVREAVAEGTYCPACKVPWSDCDCDDRIGGK